MRWLAAGALALAVACAATGCATPSPAGTAGETVSLRGVLKGMGKMGYVLDVAGNEIYFDVDEDLSPHYGETATVRGTLRHVGPVEPADLPEACAPETPCAVPPEHDRLTDATIEFDG